MKPMEHAEWQRVVEEREKKFIERQAFPFRLMDVYATRNSPLAARDQKLSMETVHVYLQRHKKNVEKMLQRRSKIMDDMIRDNVVDDHSDNNSFTAPSKMEPNSKAGVDQFSPRFLAHAKKIRSKCMQGNAAIDLVRAEATWDILGCNLAVSLDERTDTDAKKIGTTLRYACNKQVRSMHKRHENFKEKAAKCDKRFRRMVISADPRMTP